MTPEILHVDDLTELLGPEVDVAVVVDVVRAFTVAPWCLEQGAARLLLASACPMRRASSPGPTSPAGP